LCRARFDVGFALVAASEIDAIVLLRLRIPVIVTDISGIVTADSVLS
jgi:hypothetical protein